MDKSMTHDILHLLEQLEHGSSTEQVSPPAHPQDGSIVYRDGKLHVTDPQPGGRPPSLVSTASVNIRVNGVLAQVPMTVTATDRIELALVREKPFELTVSEDSMRVYINVATEHMDKLSVVENEPSFFYVPQVERVAVRDIAAVRADVLQELNNLGIASPVDESALAEALGAAYSTAAVICSGTPVQLGRDGYIETLFANSTEQLITDWTQRVDYRNHGLIPSVSAGEQIGIVHKAVPGQPGTDVFGRQVEPPPVMDVRVELRQNVSMDESGRVFARKAGRPSLTGEKVKCFEIQTVHVVEGDVDLVTGNVLFNGDVLVHGDVKEGMHVEATGNITVLGNAFAAKLVSAQNVYVQGHVTKCQVYGGRIGLLYSKVYESVGQIMELYRKLETDARAAHELAQQKQMTVTVGQLFAVLIERHYPGLKGLVHELDELLANAGTMVPVEFKLVGRLLMLFTNKQLLERIGQWQEIQKIYEYLQMVKLQIENSVCEESDIVLSSANLSQLETNGSLIVNGQGLLNCQVKAGKNCLLKSPDSSIKGGRVVVNGRIHAYDVGTPFGKSTYLQAEDSVKVKRAEGVVIKVGPKVVEILEEQHNLYFSLDKSGNLHQEKDRHRYRKA